MAPPPGAQWEMAPPSGAQWEMAPTSGAQSGPPSSELSAAFLDVVAALRTRSPKMRPALALNLLEGVKQSEVLQLFQLRSKEWRTVLAEFRDALLEKELEEEGARKLLLELKLTAEELASLREMVMAAPVKQKGSDRFLAVAAVLLGAAVLIGWMGWERWRASPPVRMRAQIVELLNLSENAGANGFEVFHGTALDIPDWLFLHGKESFTVPVRFNSLTLDGGRMISWNGGKAALFTVTTLPGFFVVTEAELLGLSAESPESGETTLGEWSGAWDVAGPYAVIWVAKASMPSMAQVLRRESR